MRRVDVAFAELRGEALEQPDLVLGQLSLRSAVAFSNRISRSCLVSRPCRCQTACYRRKRAAGMALHAVVAGTADLGHIDGVRAA